MRTRRPIGSDWPKATTLLGQQHLFATLCARLILKARKLGYEVRLEEAYRPPETARLYAKQGRGIKRSQHCERLALDLSLFRDGQYLRFTEQYERLGRYWKRLHPYCRWGGDFHDAKGQPKPDGNHFELKAG